MELSHLSAAAQKEKKACQLACTCIEADLPQIPLVGSQARFTAGDVTPLSGNPLDQSCAA